MISVSVPYADANLLAMLHAHRAKSVFEWNAPLAEECSLELKILGPVGISVTTEMIDAAIELLELTKNSIVLFEKRRHSKIAAKTDVPLDNAPEV